VSFLSQPITLQSLFGVNRKVADMTLQVVVNESTNDTLTITKQPVQQGASITDHAYKEPTVLSMTAYQKDNSLITGFLNTFSGGGLSQIYQDLLDLQSSRVPFDVITPKRIYHNMLLATLSVTTDKATENTLALNMTFQEVIIVSVVTTQVPRSKQKFSGITGAIQNAGKKSALASLKEGIGALFK
jgi:hypothetical protein